MTYRTKQNSLRLTILLWLICVGKLSLYTYPATASDSIEKSGDAVQVLIPVIAYGTTFYLDDTEGRTQFYKSFFINLTVTHGLKYTIDKQRPNGSDRSFPSGHTSAAFQGAASIHKRYGLKYSVPAYIGASFVGYSRIESEHHYIEDVLAGAAIGIVSSFYFTEPYKGVVITSFADKGNYGIRIRRNLE